jgi:KDO2-lipid IV(A) lauroyltransferase
MDSDDTGANPLAVIAVRGLLWCLACLPLAASQWLGRHLGTLLYELDTRAARVTAINLQACGLLSGEEDSRPLVLASLQHTGQTILETPAIWLGARRRLDRWISKVENESLLDAGLAAGKGVVVLLPHFGNWELLNVFFTRRQPMTALYHPPDQAYLRPVMAEIREKFGNEMVPTNRTGIARLYRRLGEGKVVTILPDQVPGNGEFVDFFGQPALTDRLITRLLQKTSAKVVTCIVIRQPQGSGFTVRFGEPDAEIYSTDSQRSMQALNRTVETCVRTDPAQYQWEYKRFRRYPDGSDPLY